MAVPNVLSDLDRARTFAAARYLAHQCGVARILAIVRSAAVALRFDERDGEIRMQMFVDGNGNGVRTREIEAGIDVALDVAATLGARFPAVRIGIAPELGIGGDPVRIGNGSLLSFTPLGTATAGSIFVVGKDGTQLVVRVLGPTARTRVQHIDRRTRAWGDQL
jgi:hypothetical protein